MAEERTNTAEPRAVSDGKGAAAHPLPDHATCRELLETMALIRRFEEEAGRQYQQAKAGGFLHLAIGEEMEGARGWPPHVNYPHASGNNRLTL